MEQGAVGVINVAIGGQTTFSLTTANNASDQARYLWQNYTGALTGACTVTLPNVARVGWASNNTTGGFNVILTAGGGTTATIPPGGTAYFWQCDGSGDVTLNTIGFGSGNLSVTGTLGVTGATTLSSTLAVTGTATLSATLSVTGTASVAAATSSGHAAQLSQTVGAGATAYGNVTASRSTSVSYTNSTGRPLFVSIVVLLGGALDQINATSPYGVTTVALSAANTGVDAGVFFLVPPGATYGAITAHSSTLQVWLEY